MAGRRLTRRKSRLMVERSDIAAGLDALATARKKADRKADVSHLREGAATLRESERLADPVRSGRVHWGSTR